MQGRNLLGNWSLLLFLSTDTKLCCPSPNYFIPLQETERLQLTNFGSPISSLTRKQFITPLPVITKKLTNLAASHFQTCICWKVSWEVCFLAEEVFCEVSICMILQKKKSMSQQDAYSLNNLLGWKFLKFKRFEQCDHVDFLNECSFWYHFSS